MIYSIPVTFHSVKKDLPFISILLKEINVKKHTMIFLSRKCYLHLKENMDNICTAFFLYNSNTLMQYEDNNNRTCLSITKLSCDWLLIESIVSSKINYRVSKAFPTSILFLYLEEEFDEKDIQIHLIETPPFDCPVDIIIRNPDVFKNSMVFLTDVSYNSLKRNTNTISYYKGIHRLSWTSDDSYPGGTIMLRLISEHPFYYLENMDFPFFRKNFSTYDLPDTIYFIK